MCKTNRFTTTRCLPALLMLAALFAFSSSQAFAQTTCSAGGSAQPIPQSGTGCGASAAENGETVDIVIRVTNTSVQNAAGNPAVTAVLKGTVGGTITGLTFTANGADGCVIHAVGVASCTGGVGSYTVTMTAGGVALPAVGSVDIATIRGTVTTAPPASCTSRSLTAATSANAITTTDANCDPQASGDASGSSSYFVVQCDAPTDCPAGAECTTPTCTANTCGTGNVADGTTCGSGADTSCDNPDTCLAGVCAPNNEPVGTQCAAAGTSPTCDPADVCNASGTCVPNVAPDGTACGDPADTVCDNPDSCLAGACVPNNEPTTTVCRVGDPATCDPAENCVAGGTCAPDVDPGACASDVCRTPGFWGNHPEIVTSLLGGGALSICGETLNNANSGNAQSAIEAICITGSGRQHLARDLASMALNCKLTGGAANVNCVGTGFEALFAECNAVCLANSAAVGSCQARVDCTNNGGVPSANGAFCGTGTCSDNGAACSVSNKTLCAVPGTAVCNAAPNCHNLSLPAPFEPPGKANPDNCKAARKNSTSIFD